MYEEMAHCYQVLCSNIEKQKLLQFTLVIFFATPSV